MIKKYHGSGSDETCSPFACVMVVASMTNMMAIIFFEQLKDRMISEHFLVTRNVHVDVQDMSMKYTKHQ